MVGRTTGLTAHVRPKPTGAGGDAGVGLGVAGGDVGVGLGVAGGDAGVGSEGAGGLGGKAEQAASRVSAWKAPARTTRRLKVAGLAPLVEP